jgi:hypothetical protein
MTSPNTSGPSLHPEIKTRLEELRTGEPKMLHGFGLWPLLAPPRPEPAYLTLVEALALPAFRITEVSEGGSVPTLRVFNDSPHHILLFDGEELKGAKQNRILNTSILVAAGSVLDVPVSCTEQGRWSYISRDFETSGSMAYAELRKRKAAAVMESLESSEAHLSNQGEVWNEIEQLHCAADTAGRSATRAMKDAYQERQRELDEFARSLPCQEGQCGLLAVIGDRVEGLDLLSRPEAYTRLHQRLVESHAMDFLVRKQGKSKKAVDPEAPARFLASAAKAFATEHDSPGLGRDHRLRFLYGHGAALQVEQTIVHLALFGGRHAAAPPAEPRILRRGRPPVE